MYKDEALVPRPSKTDAETLRLHYREVNDLRACMPYDEYADRCVWCLAVGREVPRTGTRGHPVFCSVECRDQYDIYMPAKPKFLPVMKEKNEYDARVSREGVVDLDDAPEMVT